MARGRILLLGLAALAGAALVVGLDSTSSDPGQAPPEPEASTAREPFAPTVDPHRRVDSIPSKQGPVTGTVLLGPGMPAAGAKLRLVPAEGQTGDWIHADAEGRFVIGGVPSEGACLEVSGVTAEGVHLLPTLSRGVTPGQRNVTVIARPGSTVAGRVVDEHEMPVSGALVEVRTGRRISAKVVAETRSGPNGAFELIVDTGRRCYVRAVAASTDDAGLPYAPGHAMQVEPGVQDVRIVLVRGLEIRGQLVSSDGRSVSRIPLVSTPTFPSSVTAALARTDEWGGFVIGGLRRGRYRIAFDADRHEGGPLAVVGASAVLPSKEDLRLELVAAGTLSGTILTDDGKPAGRVRVMARQDALPDWRYGFTAPTGAFRFERVPLGSWVINVKRESGHVRCGTIETGVEGVVLRMPRRE